MASAARKGNSPSPGEFCRHSPSRSAITRATTPTAASTAWPTSLARGETTGAGSLTALLLLRNPGLLHGLGVVGGVGLEHRLEFRFRQIARGGVELLARGLVAVAGDRFGAGLLQPRDHGVGRLRRHDDAPGADRLGG